MPTFSFCSTSYNNAKRINECLESIIKAAKNFEYQIVIVDNYSNDSTFEILQRYKASNFPLNIIQHKCYRGRGRQLAYKLSKGKNIVYFDTDCYYDTKKLSQLLTGYVNWKYKDEKSLLGFGILQIHPRDVIEKVGGWRNLNRAEDIDLIAREFVVGLARSFPVIVKCEPDIPSPSLLLSTFFRELRYINSLDEFFTRLLRNKLDKIVGSGYTMKNVFLTYRYGYTQSLPKILVVCFFQAIFDLLNRFRMKEKLVCDPILTNWAFVMYNKLINMENPLKLGFSAEDILRPPLEEQWINFIVQFKPEITEKIREMNKWGTSP